MNPEQNQPAVGPAKPGAHPQLIPAAWQVPDIFRRRLGRRVGKLRVMHAVGHVLLVLHAPPSPDENARTGKLYWRDAEDAELTPVVLTAALLSLQTLFQQNDSQSQLSSSTSWRS
jgi:hypothetical protein